MTRLLANNLRRGLYCVGACLLLVDDLSGHRATPDRTCSRSWILVIT